MPPGEGKDWAKGKTALSDARVARNAARHQGMAYVRRTPLEQCRWVNAARTRVAGWSPELAYAVGLIATDGCLIKRPRRIDFVTADLQLIQTYASCLARTGRYRAYATPRGSLVYRSRIKDAALYRWLLAIGLTPRKSLTLGALDVPDEHLPHVVRGLLDGDGSVINSVTAADTTRRPDGSYQYEWFRVQFISASSPHLEWLQERLRIAVGVMGSINGRTSRTGGRIFRLQFGRWESMRLCGWLYSDDNMPCLIRKRSVWESYAARHPDAVEMASSGMSVVARAAHARWARRDSTATNLIARPRVDGGHAKPSRSATPHNG